MKKLFLGMLTIALMTAPAAYADGGGKKKMKKKDRIECSKDKCCDKACPKDVKCPPTPVCMGS